jgi:hypothetical protein
VVGRQFAAARGARSRCRQPLDPPAGLREPHEVLIAAGPETITGPDRPRAAGNEPFVLAGQARQGGGARVRRRLACQSRRRRVRRGWNKVTAGDRTVLGVTLWSSAGHNVTCQGATLLVWHVWRPAGAAGLLRRARSAGVAAIGSDQPAACEPRSALAPSRVAPSSAQLRSDQRR